VKGMTGCPSPLGQMEFGIRGKANQSLHHLREAIPTYEQLLSDALWSSHPEDWASAQNNLRIALVASCVGQIDRSVGRSHRRSARQVGLTEASNDRLARVGLISASRMPKIEFRPRLSVWWALPANFVQHGFPEIRPVPIPERLGHRTPPSTTPNTGEISLAARDSHDRVPDFRCQAVPGGDKL
jgi:hypothetical protein